MCVHHQNPLPEEWLLSFVYARRNQAYLQNHITSSVTGWVIGEGNANILKHQSNYGRKLQNCCIFVIFILQGKLAAHLKKSAKYKQPNVVSDLRKDEGAVYMRSACRDA